MMLPGKCVLEQPGVNAPGTPKMTTFPSLHTSAKLTFWSGAPSNKSTLGTESPTYDIKINQLWPLRNCRGHLKV